MKKTKISSYFIFISVLTFLTIFFSMVQKSYFSFIAPQKLVENNTLLKNFDPSLDADIISLIESKNKNIDNNFDFSIIKSGQKVLDSTSSGVTPTP